MQNNNKIETYTNHRIQIEKSLAIFWDMREDSVPLTSVPLVHFR